MKIRLSTNLPFLLKVYFIVGGIVLVTLALMYNNSLIGRMRDQSKDMTRLFSRFLAIEFRDVEDSRRQDLITEIRDAISLPFVVTDMEGRPMVWARIGLPQVDKLSRILDFDPQNPDDPLLVQVLEMAREFDRINEPIRSESGKLYFVIHYGSSRLTSELAVAPYIQLAVFVLFMLLGFLGFRSMKIGEQRSIWVGMAKETAHQLGTPLSSIMGWIGMIEDEIGGTECSGRLAEALKEAQTDIDRLSKISARFSKIGSQPKLEFQKLTPIIEETVQYFERRRPSLKIHSTITVEMEELPLIRCSRDLMEWVFENLMKNALDAIADDTGKIHITGRMNRTENRMEVEFGDNGKGMNPALRNRIFSPGFTTKSRGWGLGLALVKRIVEEIHHGSIRVLHTQPGKGTIFLITFPVD
ncbi:MAG TPA: ATP-binding protein [Patescibacteria group bacterium]|nr:ATP-binding protein [Patescibacteria group bacterium]